MLHEMDHRDTSRVIQDRLDDAYRRMPVPDKVARMVALTALAHSLALARIRAEHPQEPDRRHRMRLAARWLSPEQMKKAFGWSEDSDAEST